MNYVPGAACTCTWQQGTQRTWAASCRLRQGGLLAVLLPSRAAVSISALMKAA